MISQLLLWMVMAYGMTNILVYGSIFNKTRNFIREWGEDVTTPFHGFFEFISGILSCVMCCSTWVGFFFGIFVYSPVHEMLNVTNHISWFFDGMLASGAVWAINAFIEWFELNRPKQD
jgi:hypothetical protein